MGTAAVSPPPRYAMHFGMALEFHFPVFFWVGSRFVHSYRHTGDRLTHVPQGLDALEFLT